MTLVSGNHQVAQIGQALALPFVVALKDANSNPASGVAVVFSATAGGGSTSPVTVLTDTFGQAHSTLTVGLAPGTNTVAAIATGYAGSPINFTATGLAVPTSNVWVERIPTGAGGSPPDRWAESLTWDGVGALMFGGDTTASPGGDNDLWSYDPGTNTWSRLLASNAPGSPPRDAYATFVATPRGAFLISSSGGTYAFDRTTNHWTNPVVAGDPAAPPARGGASTVWDGEQVILFGGAIGGGSTSSDLWWFDPASATWQPKLANGAPGSPSARANAMMVWDGSQVVLFGGTGAGGNTNDLWWYDPASNQWTQKIANGAPGSPGLHVRGSVVWDGHVMLLFGGFESFSAYDNSLWQYDPTTNAWTQLVPNGATGSPETRQSAGLVWTGERAVLFAGFSQASNAGLNDLWTYTPTTSPPPPSVLSVLPAEAATGAPTSVTVNGAGFLLGATVGVGSLAATSVNVVSDGVLTCTFPDDIAGVKTVTVTNPDGGAGQLAAAFARTSGAPGPPTAIAFDVPPSATWVGSPIRPVMVISLRDSTGRIVPTSASITVALAANPGGATLGGTKTVAAVNGVATFPDLTLDRAASGYTLLASAGALNATSGAFDVAINPGSHLAIAQQPTNVVSGAAVSPAVIVQVEDSAGGPITGASGTVSVALANNPGGATLSGTTTVGLVNGAATFSNLTLDRVGSGYTLAFSVNGLAGPTSTGFDVAPGAPKTIEIVTGPSDVGAGSAIAPAMSVRLRDAAGNLAATTVASVGVAIQTNPGGATLGGTTTVSTSGAVATFSNVSLDRIGTGYTFTFSSAGCTPATSGPFNVGPGPPTKLVLTASPAHGGVNVPLAPAVTVLVEDAFSNVVTTATQSVTLALGAAPVGARLRGIVTTTPVNGVATLSQALIDTVGTGYTLVVSSTGLSGVTTAPFNVTNLPPDVVSLSVPAGTLSGVVPISYALQQDNGVRCIVLVEFAPSSLGVFQRATQASSALGQADGTDGVLSSPAVGGATHIFLWDSHADFPNGLTTTAQLRVTASFRKVSGAAQTLTNLSVANSAATRVGIDLGAPAAFGAPDQSQCVRVADMNGDGKPDIVVGAFGQAQIFFGDGAGRIDGTTTTSFGIGLPSYCVADLDGDGLMDVASPGGSGVTIAYGTGSTTLVVGPGITIGDEIDSVGAGDLNEDGINDLVVSSLQIVGGVGGVSSLSVFANVGARQFRLVSQLTMPGQLFDLKCVDVNGDGHLDVVGIGTTFWCVFFGHGDGTLDPPVVFTIPPSAANNIEVVDVNGDGRPDVVIPGDQGTATVYLNLGSGTFDAGTSYAAGGSSTTSLSVAVGDVDGDGIPDILVGLQPSRGPQGLIAFLKGSGTGTFAAPTFLYSGSFPDYIALADLSGSGALDLVTTLIREGEFTTCRHHPGGFGPMQLLTSDPQPAGVVAVDLDKNGKLDVVTANQGGADCSVFLQGSGQFFGAATSAPCGLSYPTTLAAGDVDGNGAADVVVIDPTSNIFSVLLGDGAGGFAAPITTAVGTGQLTGVAVGDLDGDGKADIVIADNNSGGVWVLMSLGGGTVAPPTFYATGGTSTLFLRDMNGDGRLDLVCVSGTSIVFLPGTGTGTFGAPVTTDLGQSVGSPTVADFDGDGVLDVAVASGQEILVAPGLGNGAFGAPLHVPTGSNIAQLSSGDVNGDGRVDLVMSTGDVVGVLENRGGGVFQSPVFFHTGLNGMLSFTVADLDGDGSADVAVVGTQYVAGDPLFFNVLQPMFGR
jgi:hypothetical protein